MEKSKRSVVINVQRVFKFFDLYGQNVNLYINKKPKFFTTFSGLLSMVIIAIIIYTFTGSITSWINNEKMTPIPASTSYSVSELLSKNVNFEYEFNYQNYYIYWAIMATFPDGKFLTTVDLKNYYTYVVTLVNQHEDTTVLVTEPCKTDQVDIFLGLDREIVEKDIGKIGVDRICIKNSSKMGLFPNVSASYVYEPEIFFSLYPCVNSTKNNNSCASQEAIDEIIKYTTVQTTIPTTIYDFKNNKNIKKNIYNYHYTNLDKSMLKFYENLLITSSLYIDEGLLTDDYRLQSTNFNPNIIYDPNLRKDSDPLFVFATVIGYNFQNYYLKNEKIYEVVASLGGLINAIFLLGKVLCCIQFFIFKIQNHKFHFLFF